ncbi:MAG: hypothetical protein R2911_41015 [Caldilineaceae bacterium]
MENVSAAAGQRRAQRRRAAAPGRARSSRGLHERAHHRPAEPTVSIT